MRNSNKLPTILGRRDRRFFSFPLIHARWCGIVKLLSSARPFCDKRRGLVNFLSKPHPLSNHPTILFSLLWADIITNQQIKLFCASIEINKKHITTSLVSPPTQRHANKRASLPHFCAPGVRRLPLPHSTNSVVASSSSRLDVSSFRRRQLNNTGVSTVCSLCVSVSYYSVVRTADYYHSSGEYCHSHNFF